MSGPSSGVQGVHGVLPLAKIRARTQLQNMHRNVRKLSDPPQIRHEGTRLHLEAKPPEQGQGSFKEQCAERY